MRTRSKTTKAPENTFEALDMRPKKSKTASNNDTRTCRDEVLRSPTDPSSSQADDEPPPLKRPRNTRRKGLPWPQHSCDRCLFTVLPPEVMDLILGDPDLLLVRSVSFNPCLVLSSHQRDHIALASVNRTLREAYSSDALWHALVRAFFHHHFISLSESPQAVDLRRPPLAI